MKSLQKKDHLIAAKSYKLGDSDTRPWGMWQVKDVGKHYIVKLISVRPGQRLSLQRHKHRSERWVVVSGSGGIAEVNNVLTDLEPGVVIEIPCGAVHRLSNPSFQNLQIIEVQLGELLSEDDIERLKDDYNRGPT